MRNFFYVLVSVSLIVFGFFYTLKSNAAEVSGFLSTSNSYPYQIVEIKPSGGEETFNGISSNIDPVKIIADLSVAYYPEDKISAFPDPKVGIGSVITINRAPVINIKDGKKSKEYRSWVKTVGELISEKSIELGTDDKVNVPADAQIFDGSSIVITRVAKTTIIEPKLIDFQTVTKKNTSQEKDYKKILQTGVKGVKNYYYLVTREDGEEVSRSLIKTEITIRPTDQIVEVGTIVKVYGSGVASIWKDGGGMLAACNLVPKGMRLNIVNTSNGRSIVVTVAGDGLRPDRVVDLTFDAFSALGGTWGDGLISSVRVEKYYPQ